MQYTMVLRHSDRTKIQTPKEAVDAKLTFRGYFRAMSGGLFLRKHFKGPDEIQTGNRLRCYCTGLALRTTWNLLEIPRIEREDSQYGFFGAGYVSEGQLQLWLQNTDECCRDRLRPKTFRERFERWRELGLLRVDLDEYGEEFMARALATERLLAITHNTNVGPIMEYLVERFGFELEHQFLNPEVLSGFCISHKSGVVEAIHWIEMANDIRQIWKNRGRGPKI